MALSYGIFHQRIACAKIQKVVFVDARRHNEQRRLFYVRGLRRVLDQLNQFVLKDHVPRCNCEVTAHFKCGFVDPRNPPLLKIFNQILDSIRQTRRASFDCLAYDFRIGSGKFDGLIASMN